MLSEIRTEKTASTKKSENVQLLSFKLDDQEYALDIANVVQVIRMVAVTRPPRAAEYMEGMFNLRGKVVPVINLRKRCGLPPKAHDLNTQLLIAQVDGQTLALTVDVVSEVLTLPASSIESADQVGEQMEYLKGVGKLGDRLLLLLDPKTLLTDPSGKKIEMRLDR
jgi:purine-binding chemotaxis protein CheW